MTIQNNMKIDWSFSDFTMTITGGYPVLVTSGAPVTQWNAIASAMCIQLGDYIQYYMHMISCNPV